MKQAALGVSSPDKPLAIDILVGIVMLAVVIVFVGIALDAGRRK